jgi:hypothetical protein
MGGCDAARRTRKLMNWGGKRKCEGKSRREISSDQVHRYFIARPKHWASSLSFPSATQGSIDWDPSQSASGLLSQNGQQAFHLLLPSLARSRLWQHLRVVWVSFCRGSPVGYKRADEAFISRSRCQTPAACLFSNMMPPNHPTDPMRRWAFQFCAQSNQFRAQEAVANSLR